MVASVPFNERFTGLIGGHWLDSIGNSIIVSKYPEQTPLAGRLIAVLTPLLDHPEAQDRVLTIRLDKSRTWRCGNATLEWADEQQQRLVWLTEDGRRSVWSRTSAAHDRAVGAGAVAFPWLLNSSLLEPWLPLDVPRDILYDGARISALLDIRQMIGANIEPQERLTHILMDHDLYPMRGDYLVPGAESPLWQTLPVPDQVRQNIAQRIHRIPHEALSQRVAWSGEREVVVGRHKIACRARDIQALESRWVHSPKDERKPLEIARLLALYSVFDNPLSNRRNGVHLGLDPELRRQCDYELFASPLNAVVSNGHYASKWPHIEWRFGSIGSYPSILSSLPANGIVCVNPPFTDAYLADVMSRLGELKLKFRLRLAVPIQEAAWRKKLLSALPQAKLLRTYYDASREEATQVLHPTLLWEDPRLCPDQVFGLGEDTQPVFFDFEGIGVMDGASPRAVPEAGVDQGMAGPHESHGFPDDVPCADAEVCHNGANTAATRQVANGSRGAGDGATSAIASAADSEASRRRAQPAQEADRPKEERRGGHSRPLHRAADGGGAHLAATSAPPPQSASRASEKTPNGRSTGGKEKNEPEENQLDANEWPSLSVIKQSVGLSKGKASKPLLGKTAATKAKK